MKILFQWLIKFIKAVFNLVFPKLNAKASNTLKINDFSGGINLRDGLTEILDNQSTDVTNMYWKDGIMKTRPALDFSQQIQYDGFEPEDEYDFTDTKSRIEKPIITKSNKMYRMVSRVDNFHNLSSPEASQSWVAFHIMFAWISSNEKIILPSITNIGNVLSNYFVVQHKEDIFCFCKTANNRSVIYKLDIQGNKWNEVAEQDKYIPIVVIHCLTDGIGNSYTGTLFEGYNLCGTYYRMIYSSVNKQLLNSTNTDHLMIYPLNFGYDKDVEGGFGYGTFVKVKITSKEHGEVTHIAYKNSTDSCYYETDDDGTRKIGGDGLSLVVDGKIVRFEKFVTNEWSIATVSEEDYIEDNMEITAPISSSPYVFTNSFVDTKNLNKVFNMTQSEWFGSDALGISGGTRLFLCGNKNDDEKSLVLWSGLDNPLYFPENCYAYVGNSNQAVTGFGRQNDTLVIFKERETYYTQYMHNTNITAEDLINQNVVDYAASSVYFPMVQLHPNIGCDLPNSIQLCRNRLVWASTTGKVYTLMAQNQYSERNIYEISEMVEKDISKFNLLSVGSCDWNGYYILFYGNQVYVMDYNSYGYAYASSYNKNEDANIKIPWWHWELSVAIEYAFVCDNDIVLFRNINLIETPENISQEFYLFDENKITDSFGSQSEKEILSSFTSKLFDFNEPNKRKNIDCINISFGNNDGQPITVVVTSDSGEDEQIISLDSGEDDNRLSGYITSKAIYPILPQICRLAVTIKCTGHLAVDGMSIKYRVTGGIR